MSYWFIIILTIGGLLALGAYLSYSASLRAQALFRSLDKKYDDFVRKSITSGMVNQESYELNTQTLTEDILLVIKPDIEAIIAHINATDVSDVRVRKSRFFKNAARISEGLYEKRNKSKNTPLSQEDKDRFASSFKDAIIADLMQRKVDLKLGKI